MLKSTVVLAIRRKSIEWTEKKKRSLGLVKNKEKQIASDR